MRTLGAGVALVIGAAGCKGAVEAKRPSAATAPFVSDVASSAEPSRGFWIVTSATRDDELTKPGTAWRFLAGEYQVVRAPDLLERQKTQLRQPGPSSWEADVPSHFTVQRAGDLLTFSAGQPAPATITMRAASADEAGAAERLIASHGTIDVACAHASRCFHQASRALSPNDTREMDGGTSLRNCEATVAGYAALFKSLGRDVPDACLR